MQKKILKSKTPQGFIAYILPCKIMVEMKTNNISPISVETLIYPQFSKHVEEEDHNKGETFKIS